MNIYIYIYTGHTRFIDCVGSKMSMPPSELGNLRKPSEDRLG